MIRGPVLPQMRDSLWGLVASRLEQIEAGLTLVQETLDCSDGELGPVEGLARDAVGGVVLVMLATDGDALLSARALSAGRFLSRVHNALPRAVPEAKYCPGVPARILLVGTESTCEAMDEVMSLPIEGLQACVLEPFRIAGQERFAVRWLHSSGQDHEVAEALVAGDAGAAATSSVVRASSSPEFAVPPQRVGLWEATLSICERIDDAVVVYGDRFSRTIAWNGSQLGEVRTVGGSLVATSATSAVHDLRDLRDVRRFCDQLLRAFVKCANLGFGDDTESGPESNTGRADASMAGGDQAAAARLAVGDRGGLGRTETLRASLAESKLTPEEYSALGDPASSAGSKVEGSVATDRS